MRKMLGIAGSLLLCSVAAWADDGATVAAITPPHAPSGAAPAPQNSAPAAAAPSTPDAVDRSTLSYEENVVINTVCARAQHLGGDSYQVCVAQQLAALKDHPTPDRSGLQQSKAIAVERRCNYYRHIALGQYNDCIKRAIEGKEIDEAEKAKANPADELAPNFKKFLAGDDEGKLRATPIAATDVPRPVDVLPKLNDHLEKNELSAQELFQKVKHSVFVVVAARSRADLRQRDGAFGSAVAITDHLLLTNCHIVKDRSYIKVGQEGTIDTATLAAADYQTDRCVLKTDSLTLTPIAGVRPFTSLNVGERAFAVGTPLGLELTLSEGLVSSVRHASTVNFVQTSAPINNGSSGGGLFDDRGNLIGITSLLFSNRIGASQNFAIAASDFWK
jgi:S1-C subfamily serine protease